MARASARGGSSRHTADLRSDRAEPLPEECRGLWSYSNAGYWARRPGVRPPPATSYSDARCGSGCSSRSASTATGFDEPAGAAPGHVQEGETGHRAAPRSSTWIRRAAPRAGSGRRSATCCASGSTSSAARAAVVGAARTRCTSRRREALGGRLLPRLLEPRARRRPPRLRPRRLGRAATSRSSCSFPSETAALAVLTNSWRGSGLIRRVVRDLGLVPASARGSAGRRRDRGRPLRPRRLRGRRVRARRPLARVRERDRSGDRHADRAPDVCDRRGRRRCRTASPAESSWATGSTSRAAALRASAGSPYRSRPRERTAARRRRGRPSGDGGGRARDPRAGGSAVDAAVAAGLASCVAETVMTGLLGGGHAIVLRRRERPRPQPRLLLRRPRARRRAAPCGARLARGAVRSRADPLRGRPGVVRGAGRAGRARRALARVRRASPGARLLEPALRLARDGVELPPAHAACLAMLAPVLTMRLGRADLLARRPLLRAGERLEQPGLVNALESLAVEGPRQRLLRHDRGGAAGRRARNAAALLTRADLEAYEPLWSRAGRGRHVSACAG